MINDSGVAGAKSIIIIRRMAEMTSMLPMRFMAQSAEGSFLSHGPRVRAL